MLDQPIASQSFADAVLDGLARSPKTLPPKFLYDQRGSQLFDRICDCAEYYVTRTETAILSARAREMARLLGERPVIIELGSGASRKTRILLDAVPHAAAYFPIDISQEFLFDSARKLSLAYPNLPIFPVCADFTGDLEIPDAMIPAHAGRRVAFFPGSTIGNMDGEEALAFLKRTAALVGPGGQLLIGFDLLKAREILEPAYDDAAGVTAEFNLNLLHRMRRELSAQVDPDNFSHRAVFNAEKNRVEMHLVSKRAQAIEIQGRSFPFAQGETIHTECSYKYPREQFEEMARSAGFATRAFWTDENALFGVALFEVRQSFGLMPIAA